MPLSIKTKQVAGVTLIVGLAVMLLSGWYLSSLASIRLEETKSRALLLVNIIFQRAQAVVASGIDPVEGLKTDPGLRNTLEASAYDTTIIYAAIVDAAGDIVAVSVPGESLPEAGNLERLVESGRYAQAQAIYAPGGGMYEVSRPLLLLMPDGNSKNIGSIRVGMSTLLVQDNLKAQFKTPIITAGVALVAAVLVAMLFAQLMLRPIHVISTGLARLSKGDLNVKVDLPEDSDFGDLGGSFEAVSQRLAADRTELADQTAIESVISHLEDAVALFASDGQLLFANPAMQAVLGADRGTMAELLPAGHPYRRIVEDALAGRAPAEPVVAEVPQGGERLVLARMVDDAEQRPMGVMLVARNLAYISEVQSTLSYSRKLAALGRLSAGVAHEIKNPLNATMIHLELLKMQLADQPGALNHVGVIAAQVRRLDEVVQGFLKFTRPEDLQLRPVTLASILDGVLPILDAEGARSGVEIRIDSPPDLPPINADATLLEQVFVNLGLNACQAMPNGGRLRISAARRAGRRIEVRFEDTGMGIAPEQLGRIFDLYYTTKPRGSGIGLSLVYRTIQLHDGEITVESVPGRGTTFKLLLREAVEVPTAHAAATAS